MRFARMAQECFYTCTRFWYIGLIDALVGFGVLVLGWGGVTWLNNLQHAWNAPVFYPELLYPAVLIGLFSGGIGIHSVWARSQRIYLVRSWPRTILWTIMLPIVAGSLLWFPLTSFLVRPNFLGWLQVVLLVLAMMASTSYRWSGLHDPMGINKLLKEGKRHEADVIIAAAFAVEGLTYVNKSE